MASIRPPPSKALQCWGLELQKASDQLFHKHLGYKSNKESIKFGDIKNTLGPGYQNAIGIFVWLCYINVFNAATIMYPKNKIKKLWERLGPERCWVKIIEPLPFSQQSAHFAHRPLRVDIASCHDTASGAKQHRIQGNQPRHASELTYARSFDTISIWSDGNSAHFQSVWWKVLRRIPWAINLGFHYPLRIAVFFQVSVRHFIA